MKDSSREDDIPRITEEDLADDAEITRSLPSHPSPELWTAVHEYRNLYLAALRSNKVGELLEIIKKNQDLETQQKPSSFPEELERRIWDLSRERGIIPEEDLKAEIERFTLTPHDRFILDQIVEGGREFKTSVPTAFKKAFDDPDSPAASQGLKKK